MPSVTDSAAHPAPCSASVMAARIDSATAILIHHAALVPARRGGQAVRQVADPVALQSAQHAARARAASVDPGRDLDSSMVTDYLLGPASHSRHHRNAVFHAQIQHRRTRHLAAGSRRNN